MLMVECTCNKVVKNSRKNKKGFKKLKNKEGGRNHGRHRNKSKRNYC